MSAIFLDVLLIPCLNCSRKSYPPMKRTTLLCAMLMTSILSQAQITANQHIMKKSEMSLMTTTRQQKISAPTSGSRVVVLSENFDGLSGTLPLAIPSGWSTNTISATDVPIVPAFQIYNAATANTGGYWPVPELNLASNQFAGANDDPSPCDCDYTLGWMNTPMMDFTGLTNVALYMDIFHDQNFGAGDAEVAVSSDGGINFTTIPLVPGDTITALNVDEQFWQSVIVPLFPYDGMDSIVVRLQWSDAGEWVSGFAADNIVIQEMMAYDIVANKVVFGNWDNPGLSGGLLDYNQIPLTQVSPIQATAVISNGGVNAQSNVSVAFNIGQNQILMETFSGGPSGDIALLQSDTLVGVGTFVPTELGTIDIAAVPVAAVDDNPNNNLATNQMEITPFVYGRDNGICQLFYGNSTNYEFGNLFDIYSNDDFGAIQCALRFAAGDEGSVIQGKLYEFQGLNPDGTPILADVAATIEYSVVTADDNIAGQSNIITLPFDGTVSLEAGKTYLASILSSAATDIAVSGFNTWPGSWFHDGTSWGWTYGIPLVRLNSDESLGINNKAIPLENQLGKVQPMPANENSRLPLYLTNGQLVSVSYFNTLGQNIQTESFNALSGWNQIALPSFTENGQYFVTIQLKDQVLTTTFVK
jgi:hypothetical protein